jgi:serine/threonine-protein kinase
MNPARWLRFRELFRSAEPLAEEAREAYLAEQCAGDPELGDEVRRLLAAQTGARLDQIVRDAIAAVGVEEVRRERIGPYRIIDTLGEGGMGRVYLAERDDQHYRQKVAIKVVGFPGAAKQFVARFRAERQILANLRHPYIAQLLDGGETDDGLPYLVMEYVEGRSISDYCSKNDLALRDRLLLFRKVCEAVEHAHRNLVIHRDIKPANIWVTSEGVPKLLDFGIAKLIDDAAAGQTVAVTRMDMRLLTPEYASPEQLTGRAATTSTDVYGLGVLLYELLTGRFPYGQAGTASQELRRLICETDPEPPSSVVLRRAPQGDDSTDGARLGATPRQVHNALRGDLDKIVMMAMRKEPERRYGSAQLLADDIERHLDHVPVRARAESRGYVAAKFMRRHVVPLATAAVVLVTLAAVTIAFNLRLGQQRDEARRERDRALAAEVQAQREATTARTVSDFLVDLFEAADPSSTENSEFTTTELLERAVERVDEELAGQPATQARLLGTLASVHTSLNKLTEAQALASRSCLRARSMSWPRFSGASIASTRPSRSHPRAWRSAGEWDRK